MNLFENQGQLFDPDEYGPGSARRAARPERIQPPTEPLIPGWTYLRDRQGMIPFAHLIAGVSTNSAATTLCGRIGTRITNAGVTEMRRCPGCDIALQLQ